MARVNVSRKPATENRPEIVFIDWGVNVSLRLTMDEADELFDGLERELYPEQDDE